MFISFNYIQIKCNECNTTSHFNPGQYSIIECPICKAKEQKNGKPKPKRSTKSNKKI